MTDARTTRVGAIVHHRANPDDIASNTTRVGAIAHHRIDPATIFARTTRIGVIVFVRYAQPGYDYIERTQMPSTPLSGPPLSP